MFGLFHEDKQSLPIIYSKSCICWVMFWFFMFIKKKYFASPDFSYIFMTERIMDSIYQKNNNNAISLFMEIAMEP